MLENLTEEELIQLAKEGKKLYSKEYYAKHTDKVKEQRRKYMQRYWAKRALLARGSKGDEPNDTHTGN